MYDALLTYDIDIAIVGARYYCLNNEPYLSQRQLCGMFNLPERSHQVISDKKNALLVYLEYNDPTFHVQDEVIARAREARRRLARLRVKEVANETERSFQELCRKRYGAKLSDSFPLGRLPVLKKLLEVRGTKTCMEYRKRHPNEWETVMLRFGLDKIRYGTCQYRNLDDVAKLQGTCKECARQREQRALDYFGIVE